jgi:hypothetical protein
MCLHTLCGLNDADNPKFLTVNPRPPDEAKARRLP